MFGYVKVKKKPAKLVTHDDLENIFAFADHDLHFQLKWLATMNCILLYIHVA